MSKIISIPLHQIQNCYLLSLPHVFFRAIKFFKNFWDRLLLILDLLSDYKDTLLVEDWVKFNFFLRLSVYWTFIAQRHLHDLKDILKHSISYQTPLFFSKTMKLSSSRFLLTFLKRSWSAFASTNGLLIWHLIHRSSLLDKVFAIGASFSFLYLARSKCGITIL